MAKNATMDPPLKDITSFYTLNPPKENNHEIHKVHTHIGLARNLQTQPKQLYKAVQRIEIQDMNNNIVLSKKNHCNTVSHSTSICVNEKDEKK